MARSICCLLVFFAAGIGNYAAAQVVQRNLIETNGKLYVDTTWSSSFRPDSVFVYYYNVHSKYPESSESLAAKAARFLENAHIHSDASGYVTYRFYIDSVGIMQQRVEVLELDPSYKKYQFPDPVVLSLFDFLQTLKRWNPAKLPPGFPPFYIGTMTFKFYEGKIVSVIP